MAQPPLSLASLEGLCGTLAEPGLDLEADAVALRQLIAQSKVPAPLVRQLWRALAGERRRLRGLPPIGLFSDPARAAHSDFMALASAYCGPTAPVASLASVEAALRHAAQPEGLVIIGLQAETPWWLRLLAEPSVRVVGALPEALDQGPPRALILAATRLGPTGSDETFFVTDQKAPLRQTLADLARIGFAAEGLCAIGDLKLVSLAGYVQEEDPRLAEAGGRLKGVIGARPFT